MRFLLFLQILGKKEKKIFCEYGVLLYLPKAYLN